MKVHSCQRSSFRQVYINDWFIKFFGVKSYGIQISSFFMYPTCDALFLGIVNLEGARPI